MLYYLITWCRLQYYPGGLWLNCQTLHAIELTVQCFNIHLKNSLSFMSKNEGAMLQLSTFGLTVGHKSCVVVLCSAYTPHNFAISVPNQMLLTSAWCFRESIEQCLWNPSEYFWAVCYISQAALICTHNSLPVSGLFFLSRPCEWADETLTVWDVLFQRHY